jgi:hypothetical protein
MDMRPDTKKAFQNITDVFSGGELLKFMSLVRGIEYFDGKAADGDRGSMQLINIVLNFSNLINTIHDIIQKGNDDDKVSSD